MLTSCPGCKKENLETQQWMDVYFWQCPDCKRKGKGYMPVKDPTPVPPPPPAPKPKITFKPITPTAPEISVPKTDTPKT